MEPVKPCPKCGLELVRRRPARSLTEGMLSMFFIYPFRCQLCAHRFVTFLGHYAPAPRREYMRLPVQYSVVIRPAESDEQEPGISGTVVDLSVRGCALTAPIPFQAGQMLRLSIRTSDDETPLTIHRAVVRHCRHDRIGLQFHAIRGTDHTRLTRLLQQLWLRTDRPAFSWKFPHVFALQGARGDLGRMVVRGGFWV